MQDGSGGSQTQLVPIGMSVRGFRRDTLSPTTVLNEVEPKLPFTSQEHTLSY